jgi:hypothetical protein
VGFGRPGLSPASARIQTYQGTAGQQTRTQHANPRSIDPSQVTNVPNLGWQEWLVRPNKLTRASTSLDAIAVSDLARDKGDVVAVRLL